MESPAKYHGWLAGPVVLAGLLALLEMAAQAGSAARREAPPTALPADAADALNPDGTRVTIPIQWMGPPYFPNGHADSFPQRLVEREFGFAITPLFLDPNAYARKKPLILSGGSVPDVYVEENPATLQRAVENRFVAEVPPELIARHAPNYFRAVLTDAPIGFLYTAVGGRNYALPELALGSLKPRPGIWRADWLRAVGLAKVPETLDEMEEALRRFRENDPDGNGQRDTYGMSGDISDWWWTTFNEIFGAYGALPFDWMLREGRVVWGGTLPETREALLLLRRWYAAELIHPDFVVDSMHPGKSLERKFINGRTGYLNYKGGFGSFALDQPVSFYLDVLRAQYPREVREEDLIGRLYRGETPPVLVPAPFPIGPWGQRGARCWGAVGNTLAFGRQVAERPAVAVRVLQMFERSHTDAVFHAALRAGYQRTPEQLALIQREAPQILTGFEAFQRAGPLPPAVEEILRTTHWVPRYDPTDGTLRGREMVQQFIDEDGTRVDLQARDASRRRLLDFGISFFHRAGDVRAHNRQWADAKAEAFNETYAREEWALINVLGKPDVVPSAAEYQADLRMRQQTVFAEIISGRAPPETFEAFVEEYYRRGGAVLTEEANALHRELETIYARLRALLPEAAPTAALAPRR